MNLKVKKFPWILILKPPAFLEIILASAESYHSECYGIMLGYVNEKEVVVEDAQVLQDVKKSPYGVTPFPKREKRLIQLIKSLNLDNLNVIGDFHSHPMIGDVKGKPVPSGDDILDMKVGFTYLIVAINESKRNRRWSYNEKRKVLKGSIFNFNFEISAYYCHKNLGYKKLQINCPFLMAIDRSQIIKK
ncbi:MAG: Mov34/MPN/PAD-1 family protein [Candidatus Hydrothermales bacterium]